MNTHEIMITLERVDRIPNRLVNNFNSSFIRKLRKCAGKRKINSNRLKKSQFILNNRQKSQEIAINIGN